jgi:molybdenum cofactor cytidylyltransferase
MNVAIAILAAGSSRRLGRPKQQVIVDGRTLLQRAVDTACASGAARVLLMLGADADTCWQSLSVSVPVLPALERLDVPDHAEGMAASIRAAVIQIENDSGIDALLVMLVDQYRVDTAWLRGLLALADAHPQRTVASRHDAVLGAPAVFPRARFAALRALRGDIGARALLRMDDAVIAFPAPHAPGDVDTPEQIPPA